MKSSAQLERRRFERAPITAQVEYELTNSSSGPSRVRRNMANVSLGGMFITTEEPIRVGTRMVVRFELPNHHRVILALSTAFWDTYLRNDARAKEWLDGGGPQKLLEPGDHWQKK